MAIYLIRHGETEGNRQRVMQKPEVPLSEYGIVQAKRLGARLADAGISHILSSDLTRAAMTADALCVATDAKLSFDAGLHERNLGDLRGRAYAEFDFDPFGPDYAPPGGETWDEFHVRVADVWPRIEAAAAHAHGHLAVVTHGLVCRRIVQHYAEHTHEAQLLAGWNNTSLTILDGPDPWRVELLNCTEHLLEVREGGAA